MHELSIAISLIEMAEEQAREHEADPAKLLAMHLALGPLSGVEKEALVSAFELAREASPFPACKLEIEDVPLTGECSRCGEVRPVVSPLQIECATCGAAISRLVSGREMQLRSLEFEQ